MLSLYAETLSYKRGHLLFEVLLLPALHGVLFFLLQFAFAIPASMTTVACGYPLGLFGVGQVIENDFITYNKIAT